jgi:hypothetical protein
MLIFSHFSYRELMQILPHSQRGSGCRYVDSPEIPKEKEDADSPPFLIGGRGCNMHMVLPHFWEGVDADMQILPHFPGREWMQILPHFPGREGMQICRYSPIP